MLIIFDIDGTIMDCDEIIEDLWRKFKNDETLCINKNTYDLIEKFGCSEEELRRYFAETSYNYIHSNYRDDAKPVIDELRSRGHRIAIVTARGSESDTYFITHNYEQETIKSLANGGINYDEFHFGINDKATLAVKLNAGLVIEDAAYQYDRISKVVPTHVVARGYNTCVPEHKRMENLYEVLALVDFYESEVK